MLILIVEDEPLIGLALEAILIDAGHRVQGVACAAAQALALLEQVRPDLMLVDIDLTDGKGAGLRLAREARDRWGVPVLFVSAQSSRAREGRDFALGFLSKPFNRTALLAGIEAARTVAGGGAAECPPGLELFRQPSLG
ncbi:MAG TPA: response regulator [Azospirillaceae bacterium]|nr:response regulator [Azospirillaceae bacterium]